MRAARFFLILLFPIGVGGCAIHPLPEQSTHLQTKAIVDQIRCEARAVIERASIALLRGTTGRDRDVNVSFADDLERHPDKFLTLKAADLPTLADQDFYGRYIETGIAFDFTFDMTETNNVDTTVDLVKLISGGTASLGLSAHDDLSRQNVRHFVVTNTFERLLQDKHMRCGPLVGPDYAYPVAGSVGLDAVISSFIDLNEEELLKPNSAKSDSPVFADTLTFLTTLSVSAVPSVTLTPTGHPVQVMNASLSGTASRVDKHTLGIGLSLEPQVPQKGGERGSSVLGLRATPSVFAKRRSTESEDRAAEAVDQLRVNQFLQNFSGTIGR